MDSNELFEQNRGLVYYTMNKYYPGFKNDEDLQQEALIGLWNAARTYNEDKNIPFAGYAVPCIRNQIRRTLHKRLTAKQQFDICLLSLDLNYSEDDDECTLYDMLGDSEWYERTMESTMVVEDTLKRLMAIITPSQKETLIVWDACEYNYTEAAKILGVSKQCVYEKIKRIRKILERMNVKE